MQPFRSLFVALAAGYGLGLLSGIASALIVVGVRG